MENELTELLNTWLTRDQIDVYNLAVNSLKLPIPGKQQPDYRAFGSNNIQLQDSLDVIKTQLMFVLSRKKPGLMKLESALYQEAKEEGMKTVAERSGYAYGSNKYIDYKTELDSIEILINRINSLGWQLKNQLSLIG